MSFCNSPFVKNSLRDLRVKKTQQGGGPAKDEPEGPVNEELKALEAHVLKLSKQGEFFIIVLASRASRCYLDTQALKYYCSGHPPERPVNEVLKALEAHVLKLSKQGEIL